MIVRCRCDLVTELILTRYYVRLQIHIVRFDGNKHIQNVRIYWDQASLLRQVEVIGSRARSWPIRDANDQTRLIKSAIAAKPAAVGSAPPPTKQEEQQNEEEKESRPVTPAGKRRIKDPYAAESLTDLLSPGNERAEPVRAPRSAASAKPPPRDYEELFVGDDGDANEELDASPSKRGSVMPKVGAGKNFQPNRLFDDDETVAAEDPRPLAYRPHPNRFSHFDIGGDNSEREVQEKPAPGRTKSRHVAQWGFDDFVTPEKPRRQLRGQERHQFPWEDETPQPTPTPRVPVAHPRRDAETHEEEPPKAGRMVSSFQNKHMSLYRDPLFDSTEDGEPEPPAQETRKARPHSLASNGTHRRKNFENHWDMDDDAVADSENQKPFSNSGKDRIKSVQMMEPHWEAYDESPKRPSVAPPRNGVRNAYHRSWDIGDGDE